MIQRITNRSSIEFRAADAELRCVALEAEDGECSVAVCFLPFLAGEYTELKRSVTAPCVATMLRAWRRTACRRSDQFLAFGLSLSLVQACGDGSDMGRAGQISPGA